MGALNNLWLVTIATAFWGPILAVNGFPHLFAFRVLFLLHFCALAITLLRFKKITAYCEDIKVRDQLACFAFWVIWAAITLIWADNKLAGARHLWSLFSGVSLISFTVLYLNSTARLLKYAGICTATLVIFMGIGFWETQTGLHIKQISTIDPVIYAKELYIPTGVFTNRNDFATYLALFLPFLYAWTRHAPWWTKLWAWPFIMLGIYLINVTTSRANILALILILVTAVLLWFYDLRKKGLRSMVTMGLVLVLLGGGAVYAGVQSKEVKHFVYQVTSLQSETQIRGGSIQVRVGLIKGGLEMLKEHYFMGVGAGNVEEHMQAYWLQTRGLQNLHNWWLEVLVNYGIFIWGLYLYCYGQLYWNLGIVFRKADNLWLRRFAEACLLSMTGFLIGCTSSSTLYSANYMWILYGIGLAVYNRYLSEQASGSPAK